MNMVVAGPADPQNEGARFLTLEQPLGALLAMAGARNQVMTGQRGHEPAAQLATGWFRWNAAGPDHACLDTQTSSRHFENKKGRTKERPAKNHQRRMCSRLRRSKNAYCTVVILAKNWSCKFSCDEILAYINAEKF